ncbi:MAG: cation diffusion facilitator family transporter [Bacteroidota bacterium]
MHHHHNHAHESHNGLRSAFFINLVFAVIELVGGLYTNSMAILSDALHDLGDVLSLGIAWYFEKLSKGGRSERYTYGLRRFSLLGALINGIILIVGSIIILYHAIPRVMDPQQPDLDGMLILAILGVIFNGWAIFKIRAGRSLNERMAEMHLWEDVLGWVAVLVGAIVMRFVDAPVIDPLLSMGIAAFILFNVFRKLKSAFLVLLQGTPEHIASKELKQAITAFEEVIDLHDCHIWSMDGDYAILTLHLVLNGEHTLQTQAKLKERVRKIAHEHGINHVTIEFEGEGEHCEFNDC